MGSNRQARAIVRRSARRRTQPWTTLRSHNLRILQAVALARIPWLIHGFTTRLGGTSPLDGARVLNLGQTDWDARENVLANREKLQVALDARELKLITLRQVHSDLIHVIEAPSAETLRGDALITHVPGLLLAVQTADCVPILLVDPQRRVVAAVHAGWRGTLRRIVAKAVGRMRAEFGIEPANLLAAFGPAIGRCCYEVGPEIAQAFASQFAEASQWFEGPFAALAAGAEATPLRWLSATPPGHVAPPRLRLDLLAANRWQLVDAGMRPANIVASALCTACRTDLLFSHRRESARTGRQMGLIGIRP